MKKSGDLEFAIEALRYIYVVQPSCRGTSAEEVEASCLYLRQQKPDEQMR